MIPHASTCRCAACKATKVGGHEVLQSDLDLYADEWERWIGDRDGEARKMRAGEAGAPSSPRWVALQAIAAARICERFISEQEDPPAEAVAGALRTIVAQHPHGDRQLEAVVRAAIAFGWRLRADQQIQLTESKGERP